MPPSDTSVSKKAAKKPVAPSKSGASQKSDNTSRTKTQNANSKSHTSPQKGFFNLRRMIARIFFLYLLYQYFMICPTLTPSEKSPTCRTLEYLEYQRTEMFRQLEPHARPYIKRTQDKVEPYFERLVPIYNKAKPVYDKVEGLAVKYAKISYTKGRENYVSYVHPRVILASSQAHQAAQPYFVHGHTYYRKNIQPQLSTAESHATAWYQNNVQPHVQVVSKHASTVPTIVQPYYEKTRQVVIPASQRTLDTLRPLGPASAQYYRDIVKPSAIKTYKVSRNTYVTHIHPRTLHALEALRAGALRFYSIYVHPQLEKIWAKMFEYKTKKAEMDATREVVDHAATLTSVEDDLDDFIDELRMSVAQEKTAEIQEETAVEEASQEEEKSDEEIKAEIAEKRRRLEALRDRYEAEIEKLGQVERSRLIVRLKSIRIETIGEISTRVDPLIDGLASDGQDLVTKLERYFTRVSKEKDAPISDRLADADLIQTRAKERVASIANKLNDEIDSCAEKHWEREQDAVLTSHASLKRLVTKAQEELGFGWTWQPDVRYIDWQRYHGLARSEQEWWAEYMAIQNGTISETSLPLHVDALSKLAAKKEQIEEKAEDVVNLIDMVHFEGTRKLRADTDTQAQTTATDTSNPMDEEPVEEFANNSGPSEPADEDIKDEATTPTPAEAQTDTFVIVTDATPSEDEIEYAADSVIIVPDHSAPAIADEGTNESIDEDDDKEFKLKSTTSNEPELPLNDQVDPDAEDENPELSFTLRTRKPATPSKDTSNVDPDTAEINDHEDAYVEKSHDDIPPESSSTETSSIPVHQDAHDEL